MPTLQATHRVRARFLRKVSGSSSLTNTMRKAVRVLAEAGIPSLVVGGYAMQENGYPRFTSDVDMVVPNVAAARERLATEDGCEVKLLPGGELIGRGPVPLPMPVKASTRPKIASLRTLIEMKLSAAIDYPFGRMKDRADVIALIQANKIPRDFPLHDAVLPTFLKTWDDLRQEQLRDSVSL